jgi:sporulation protein YlmC with PRC-barrel domain
MWSRPEGSVSTVLGWPVRNPEGENLGRLDEIVLDFESGRVGYAVISHGGMMGIGEKLFAVPWSEVWVDSSNRQLLLDVDPATFEEAPGFDPENPPPLVPSAVSSEQMPDVEIDLVELEAEEEDLYEDDEAYDETYPQDDAHRHNLVGEPALLDHPPGDHQREERRVAREDYQGEERRVAREEEPPPLV